MSARSSVSALAKPHDRTLNSSKSEPTSTSNLSQKILQYGSRLRRLHAADSGHPRSLRSNRTGCSCLWYVTPLPGFGFPSNRGSTASSDWAWWWSPSQINFLIFTSVWTLLALIYLIIAPARYPTAAHKFGILAAEVLTMLFWFAGFIALAVLLTDVGCSAGGAGHWWGPCRAAIAGDVFAAFEW